MPKFNIYFHRVLFTIELGFERDQITCLAGHTTTTYKRVKRKLGIASKVRRKESRKTPHPKIVFAEALCGVCPLRACCINSKTRTHKIIRLHPQEDLLPKARADSLCPSPDGKTETFKERYRQRIIVEHSIARLVQRCIRKSRYVGRRRTLWQLAMAAAVVNFMRIASITRAKRKNCSFFGYPFRLTVAWFANERKIMLCSIGIYRLSPVLA